MHQILVVLIVTYLCTTWDGYNSSCYSSSSAPFDRLDETTFETPSNFESVSIYYHNDCIMLY